MVDPPDSKSKVSNWTRVNFAPTIFQMRPPFTSAWIISLYSLVKRNYIPSRDSIAIKLFVWHKTLNFFTREFGISHLVTIRLRAQRESYNTSRLILSDDHSRICKDVFCRRSIVSQSINQTGGDAQWIL